MAATTSDVAGAINNKGGKKDSSDFNNLLFNLHSEIPDDTLQAMCQLCSGTVHRRRLEMCETPYDLFELLVEGGIVSENDTQFLKDLLEKVRRTDLVQRVEQFTIGQARYSDTERALSKPHVYHNGDTTVVKSVSDDKHPSISKSDTVEATKTLIGSEDKVLTKRGRVMIVGQYGVGKTSLKRSLFKEKFNKNYDSTIGVELFQFSMDISDFFKGPDKSKGTQTQREMRRRLADELQKRLKEKTQRKPVPENDSEIQCRDNKTNTTSENDEGTSLSKENESGPTNDGEELTDLLKQLQLEGEDGDTLITNLIKTESQADIESFIDFSLWDFAGQSEYYTTHQVFLDNKSIYLLVADASHNLDDQCPEDKSQSDTEGHHQIKHMKYKDYLAFWLNLIHAHSTQKTKISIDNRQYTAPLIILVATKKDKLKKQQDDFVQEMRLYLAEKCTDAFNAHVFQKTFVIDNSESGTENEDTEIQDLRDCLKGIVEAELFTKDTPLKWLRLELALKMKRDLTKSAVTRKSLMDSATQLGISEKDTKVIFDHFHEIGMVYIYRDLLVFDTEWLTSFLGKIISIRLKDVPTQYEKRESSLIDLRHHGILHKELLDVILYKHDTSKEPIPVEEIDLNKSQIGDHVTNATQNSPAPNHIRFRLCQGLCAHNDECNEEAMELIQVAGSRESIGEDTKIYNRKKVIKLLQKFDLVYTLDESTEYIVPSLLPLGKREVIPLGEEKCYHTIPLYYHFSGGFLPEGFYYRLVVRCLTNWDKQMDVKKLKQSLKYHQARIQVDKRHTMSLSKQGSDIVMVMWYAASDKWTLLTKPKPSICVNTREFVERSMNEIIKVWMPTLRYEAMVRCCCKGHQSTNENTDSENWINDDNFVYHDIQAKPSYQVNEENESAPGENVEQNREYVGPDRVLCTEMSNMMDLRPVKSWFHVSCWSKIRGFCSGFSERMPKLGVVASVLVIIVVLWMLPLKIQDSVFQCTAFPSTKEGIALFSQCIVISILVIGILFIATTLCIFYSRNSDEYRNVRALFLIVVTVSGLWLTMVEREIERMVEDCGPVTNISL